jgi:hypothetical protein
MNPDLDSFNLKQWMMLNLRRVSTIDPVAYNESSVSMMATMRLSD